MSSSEKIVTAYRFDDFRPQPGKTVHCFKTQQALFDFAASQGKEFIAVRFWKIEGNVIRDEGGVDGWVIRVIKCTELPKKLY
jgi:hypothetical protein